MKFRQIEAFRYIMLRGTTAAAAVEMHVTQPAVSRLIKDLESSLGFMLFERRGNRLNPTLEASEFFKSVEESFLGLEKLEFSAQKIRSREPKEITIASTSAVASSILPLAVKEHKKYYPEERFSIYTNSVSEIVAKLQSNSIDLAVGLVVPDLPGIEQEVIGHARYVFAAPYVHPLATKEVICVEDLVGESVLTVVDSTSDYWSKLHRILEPIQPSLTQHISIDTSHTAYSMIATGLAVGVLEPFAAKVWEGCGVVTRPFEPAITYPYGLAYPTHTRHRHSLNKFIESLRTAAETMSEFTR
ncbi:LysR family transcriptional regulator [Vibrio sp. WJH972]